MVGSTTSSSSSHRGGLLSILLLFTVLMHGILVCMRYYIGPMKAEYQSNHRSETMYNEATPSSSTSSSSGSSGGLLSTLGLASTFTTTSSTSTPTVTTIRYGNQRQQRQQRLPHWMIVTECSIYSLDCMTRGPRDDKYLEYPLPPTGDAISKWPNVTQLSSSLPTAWKQRLSQRPTSYHPAKKNHHGLDHDRRLQNASNISKHNDNTTSPAHDIDLDDLNYLYPPTVSPDAYQQCLTFTHDKSTVEQLDALLDSKRITPEPDTNMVAFTISDWNYAYDMMHDVVQMMDTVVGFSQQHFFLVAIDTKTVDLACRHGYPVLLWKAPPKKADSDGHAALRDAVANTKVVLSYELAKRGVHFFFAEMDVWWIRSVKPDLIKLQQADDSVQIYFSAHQNNPFAPNIGVYAARANAKTVGYFQLCIDLLAEKPATHDQYVMQEVRNLYESVLNNRNHKFGDRWDPKPAPEVPTVNASDAFGVYLWTPHEIVGDERPVPTSTTLAIHTLNGAPLQLPHGKKMIARELGAYYGFETTTKTMSGATGGNDDPNAPENDLLQSYNPAAKNHNDKTDLAGYYHRRGAPYRRYLLLDSHLRTNFISMVLDDRYHSRHIVQVILAILMALAIRTNRILVLPQLMNADMDAGMYMIWNSLDYSRIEFEDPKGYTGRKLDLRETNFMSNPKSWRIPDRHSDQEEDDDYWPFESVATTSLRKGPTSNKWTIWAQTSDKDIVTWRQAWSLPWVSPANGNKDQDGLMDALFGALTSVPEIDDTELLLVDLESISNGNHIGAFSHHLQQPDALSPMEQEIWDVYKKLGQCWDRGMSKTAGKSSASDSCYGIGRKV